MNNAESIHTDAVQRQIDALRVNGPWRTTSSTWRRARYTSEVLDAPLTAETRSRKLAGLGHLFDGAIFRRPNLPPVVSPSVSSNASGEAVGDSPHYLLDRIGRDRLVSGSSAFRPWYHALSLR